MIQSQERFQTPKRSSLIRGMKTRMGYGDHQRYEIQHTKDLGKQRKLKIQNTRANGKSLGLITQQITPPPHTPITPNTEKKASTADSRINNQTCKRKATFVRIDRFS